MDRDQHGQGDVLAPAPPAIAHGGEEEPVAQVSKAIATAELLGFVLGHRAADRLGRDVGDD
jgi:hypothetical protein